MSEGRRLYVMRHAKSSWDDPAQPDHDRPLSDRGLRATQVMASYIASHEINPGLVLCSSARRTRETLEGLGLLGTTMIEHRLYGANTDDLLQRLRMVPPELASVMLVGHNPALQMLILRLAVREAEGRTEGAEGLAEIRRKLPTGALATLEFAGDWSALAPGAATLTGYVRPKALQFP